MKGRVLTIAGSDSGGGAGIQADVKTITAMGGYAASAITAITAQNTVKVSEIFEIPADLIKKQAEMVISDIGADAIKTGMLFSVEIILTVAEIIKENLHIPFVLDPVMVASSGGRLLEQRAAVDVMRKSLVPLATIVTPNIPEAAVLSGRPIRGVDDMVKAGKMILTLGAEAVLVKGGHDYGSLVTDVLVTPDTVEKFTSERIKTSGTHGTGCTLASAIATGLAQGRSLYGSIENAREFVRQAMLSAPGLGRGQGPLNHGWNVQKKMVKDKEFALS